ncbi:hypothetical protein E2P60_04090 [Candidatus Bathyarchaeota archaeon]|nr:hypothetical protein E2P60_04090 [Candidatus Bathyarchaeota archaeon]
MPSRLAISKLKAFLIIDLIFLGAVISTYFYFQDQGLIVVGLKPATFAFSDLNVYPAEVYPGEAIQISLNATNVGDLEGNETLNLEINDVLRDTKNITLAGAESQIIEFTHIETMMGNYTVKVGDLIGTFIVKPAPPETSKIILSNLKVDPYEVWADEPVTLTAIAQNPTTETDRLTIKIIIDDVLLEYKFIELEAGTSQTVEYTINASSSEGRHTVKLNTLSGSYIVVKTGYHTLMINRSGGGSQPLPFTLDGRDVQAPFQEVLPIGEYRVSVPDIYDVGTGVLEFSYWSDGVKTASRTVTLDNRLVLVATYTIISGWASCPSLYVWNGTQYVYVCEVSNSGWLGDIDHIDANGQIVFAGGNKWDYIKLGENLIQPKDGYFDIVLTQQWDELFYFDSTYMMVVDHPADVDVYTTMSNYVNTVFNDQIYTVNPTTLMSPVNATYIWAPVDTNEEGENVLSLISQLDGVFTPGNNGLYSQSWTNISLNQLAVDLGDLSGAKQIKLLLTGMADWGDPTPYYPWIASFEEAAAQGLIADGTEMCPAPYMEVKDANGNWIKVPKDKQIPLPSDYVPRTFVVDITDLFPAGTTDFQIRINNFWNISWDYIGIDLSAQENIIVQKIIPDRALLGQIGFETLSNSYGAFTRYGDVTSLVQIADEMYVIGRQGDQIHVRFPIVNLATPDEGMVREYFIVTACFYKDEPGEWGYGFNFSVDPLPFQGMSGYPYPDTESYPYDPAHLAYLEEYNTRVIAPP